MRIRLTGWLGLLAALLMLALVVLSAYIRLSQTGIGCSGWPQCQGEWLRQALQTGAPADSTELLQARDIHRLLAPAVLLVSLLAMLLALIGRVTLWQQARLGFFLVLLAAGLAALGIAAGRSGLPAVVLGNLLGGFLMLTIAWRLAGTSLSDSDHAPMPHGWVRVALLLLLLQIALGGLISATHGASACSGFGACWNTTQTAGWNWDYLNPWIETVPAQILPGEPRGAWLQLLHHAGALALLVVLALIALIALLRRRWIGALVLLALLAAQAALGLQLAPAGFPLPQVLAHNLIAALLLALLARWA